MIRSSTLRYAALGVGLACAGATLGHAETAPDAKAMMAACDAPIAKLIETAEQHGSASAEFTGLRQIVLLHRRDCATAMAVKCHFSGASESCLDAVIQEADLRAEAARAELAALAQSGVPMLGALPDYLSQTAESRARSRAETCARPQLDASVYVGHLGGDARAACEVAVAISQWAGLSGGTAAARALQRDASR